MDIIKLRKIKIKTDNIIHVIYNFFYEQGFILLNIIQEQTFNLLRYKSSESDNHWHE